MSRGYSQALTLPFLHFKSKGNQSIFFGQVPYFPQYHSCVIVISFGGLDLRGWGIIQQQHTRMGRFHSGGADFIIVLFLNLEHTFVTTHSQRWAIIGPIVHTSSRMT